MNRMHRAKNPYVRTSCRRAALATPRMFIQTMNAMTPMPSTRFPGRTGVSKSVYRTGPPKSGKRFWASTPMAIPSHPATAV